MVKFAFLAAMALGVASPAQAAPISIAPFQPDVVLVRDGCGLGGHRTPRGFCAPNGYGNPFFRGCPYRFHPTPYGCRRNF